MFESIDGVHAISHVRNRHIVDWTLNAVSSLIILIIIFVVLDCLGTAKPKGGAAFAGNFIDSTFKDHV